MNLFGQNLKIHRKKMGLTQLSLANRLKFDCAQLISNIERGKQGLAPRHFKKVSRVIGVQVEDLLDWHISDYKRELRKAI